jgi:hypothetical protein
MLRELHRQLVKKDGEVQGPYTHILGKLLDEVGNLRGVLDQITTYPSANSDALNRVKAIARAALRGEFQYPVSE